MSTLADQANYTNEIAAIPAVVSHWPLGESSATTATDVISARNGTYTGTPAFGQPALVSGAGVGTSVGFSGNDGATIAHHNDHAVMTFTVFGHAINTNNAAAQILWAKDDDTAAIGGFSAEIEPGGRPRAYFRNSGPALVEIFGGAGVIPLGQEFFWAVTAGAGGLKFHVGTTPGAVTLAASSATAPNVNLAAVTAAIGRWPPSLVKPFIGRVQHTVFVAREMSQSQLAALCRPLQSAVQTRTETVDALNPVSHYPMNPSSGTTGAIVDRLHAGDASWHGDLTATGIQYWAETLAEGDAGGGSIGFDGATGRATIPHRAEHKPAGGGGIAFLMTADRSRARSRSWSPATRAGPAAAGRWS